MHKNYQLVATENCAMRKRRRCCVGASSGSDGKSGSLTAGDRICLELRDLQVVFCSSEFVFEFFFTFCLNLNLYNGMCLNFLLAFEFEFEFVQWHV